MPLGEFNLGIVSIEVVRGRKDGHTIRCDADDGGLHAP